MVTAIPAVILKVNLFLFICVTDCVARRWDIRFIIPEKWKQIIPVFYVLYFLTAASVSP
jgi:hypothetical protein